jgi:hypothetical protein
MHAGIFGNKHADALAKKLVTTFSDIRTAGFEGNPFYNIHWLTKEDTKNQTQTLNHIHATNMAHPPHPRLWYLPNHRDALQAHIHLLHNLGNAKTEASYHAYYQTLIKNGTANGATSNAYLTSSDVPFKTKCIIMKYRTGTLYNQKHAVLFKLSTSQTCPLCPQVDSALHILSGCQHTQIRNMITKRHNIACRMILKAIRKTGSLGSCIVSMDIGCNKRMTMQNLQIPETAESRIVPKWLFPPRFPDKDRFTSSRPHIVLVNPIAAKTHKQQTNVGGWVLRSGRVQLRETGSFPAAPPATSRATNPRQHRPKDLNKTRCDIHLVEIKYCEDTRPQNQLNAAKEQHKDVSNILQGASVTLHIILLGVGGTIYTLEPFKELGLDSQRVKKLASKLHVHSVNFAAKLVHTRRALSSTVINSHQEPVSGQACNPLDPH